MNINQYTIIFPVDSSLAIVRSTFDGFDSDEFVFISDQKDDDHTYYGLASHHFERASSGNQLSEIASTLITIFNGAMFLLLGTRYTKIRVDSIYEHGKRIEVDGPPLKNQILDLEYRKCKNDAAALIEKSKNDIAILDILRYIGHNGISWISLYAALDFIKSNTNEIEFNCLSSVTKSQIKNFTHHANNFEATGVLCRHGNMNASPPSNPMSLEAAYREVMAPIIFGYINSRK